MDQPKTKDGKPYGPVRYEQLVYERYIISKATHTSYLDTGKLTPKEREYIIKYVLDEKKMQDDAIKEIQNKNK